MVQLLISMGGGTWGRGARGVMARFRVYGVRAADVYHQGSEVGVCLNRILLLVLIRSTLPYHPTLSDLITAGLFVLMHLLDPRP